MRGLVALSIACCLMLAVPAAASDSRGDPVVVPSVTPSGPTDLVQRAATLPTVALNGWLALPADAATPVPAIVLAHGSGGITDSREFAWADRLQRLGLATLVVDSFGPRGIRSTGSDQRQLSTIANAADVLAALRFLAADPRIDPQRIAVMGFSRGGQAALYAALEPFRRAVAGDLRFAAHVALYPSCSLPYLSEAVSTAPVFFGLAGDDDYTPATACERYAAWFRDKGAAVTLALYPGARHGFDTPGTPRLLKSAQTVRNCDAEFLLEPTRLRRRGDGGILTEQRDIDRFIYGCAERGAHFGGDPAALAQATQDVADFLRATLRP